MKRSLNGLIWIGLGISLFLVLFLSPFASSSPDGLKKVGQVKGFSEKGERGNLWRHAPLADYRLPWIQNGKGSIALSGLVGTLAIFLIGIGMGKLIRKAPSRTSPDPP